MKYNYFSQSCEEKLKNEVDLEQRAEAAYGCEVYKHQKQSYAKEA